MVLEFAEFGSLEEFLNNTRHRNDLSDNDLIRLCFDCVKGMIFLSRKGIIHRDLAARNVLVDGTKHAKVENIFIFYHLSVVDIGFRIES